MKNTYFQTRARKDQHVLIWLLHFVGQFNEPDPHKFLQHTLTQSHYAWDHAIWTLLKQHRSPLPQVGHQRHWDGPN